MKGIFHSSLFNSLYEVPQLVLNLLFTKVKRFPGMRKMQYYLL